MGNSMSRKKMPPWYGVPSGPVIVARHFIISSEWGPALQLEGGSFASSVSSFWMRLVMLMFRMWVWTCLFNSRFCISIYILYGIFCISIFLIDKIKIKIKIKPSSNYSIQYFEVILK